MTMYVYNVLCLSCNIKSPKHLSNCLKIADLCQSYVKYDVSGYILVLFLSVSLHKSGTRNALLCPEYNRIFIGLKSTYKGLIPKQHIKYKTKQRNY